MKTVSNGDGAQIMRLKDLSEYLRVHPTTIYRLCEARAIPHFRLGKDYRFQRQAIDKWIKQHTLKA